MPWDKTPAARARDAQVYGPEYRRNRAIIRRRSGGRCELVTGGQRCGSTNRVQCDHIVPVTQGGTHDLGNLHDVCKPHHDQKTAQEGRGYRKTAPDPAPSPRTAW